MAAKFTEDGHLVFDDGWICPQDAHELFLRYADNVRRLCLKWRYLDDLDDLEQRVWLKLLSPPGSQSRFPMATDMIAYVNAVFLDSVKNSNKAHFWQYINHLIRNCFLTSTTDAATQRGNVSLDQQSRGGGDDGDYEPRELIMLHRDSRGDGLKNDIDRVLLLKEFLAFVELHDPDFVPHIVALEDQVLSGCKGATVKRTIALAEAFAGEPFSNRTKWYSSSNRFSVRPRRPSKRADGSASLPALKLISDSTSGLTLREVALRLDKPLSHVRSYANYLLRQKTIKASGERDGDTVYVATGVSLVIKTHGRKKSNKDCK
jgi:hypothetical protein